MLDITALPQSNAERHKPYSLAADRWVVKRCHPGKLLADQAGGAWAGIPSGRVWKCWGWPSEYESTTCLDHKVAQLRDRDSGVIVRGGPITITITIIPQTIVIKFFKHSPETLL